MGSVSVVVLNCQSLGNLKKKKKKKKKRKKKEMFSDILERKIASTFFKIHILIPNQKVMFALNGDTHAVLHHLVVKQGVSLF